MTAAEEFDYIASPDRMTLRVREGHALNGPVVRVPSTYVYVLADSRFITGAPQNDPNYCKVGTVLMRRGNGNHDIFDRGIDHAIGGGDHERLFYDGVPYTVGESTRLMTLLGSMEALEANLWHVGTARTLIEANLEKMQRLLAGARDEAKVAAGQELFLLGQLARTAPFDQDRADGHLRQAYSHIQGRADDVDRIRSYSKRRRERLMRYRRWCDRVITMLADRLDLVIALLERCGQDHRAPAWETFRKAQNEIKNMTVWLEKLRLPRPYAKHILLVRGELLGALSDLAVNHYTSAWARVEASRQGLATLAFGRRVTAVRTHLRPHTKTAEEHSRALASIWISQLLSEAAQIQDDELDRPMANKIVSGLSELLESTLDPNRSLKETYELLGSRVEALT